MKKNLQALATQAKIKNMQVEKTQLKQMKGGAGATEYIILLIL